MGQDDCAAVGFNGRTGEQAFSWQWNRMPPDEFGRTVLGDKTVGLGWRWKNAATGQPAYVMIERNNHGHATLTGLLRLANYPRDRVYHHKEPTQEDAPESKSPGWPHTTVGHAHLTSEIGKMLREQSPILRDRETLHAIRRVGSGPIGAEYTGRDLAVAAGLASLAIPHAVDDAGWIFLGGRMVNLITGEKRPKLRAIQDGW